MSQERDPAATTVWSHAWQQANTSFYQRESAESHFETSMHHGPAVATHLAKVILTEYGRYNGDEFFVIDIGSGSGRLLELLCDLIPAEIHLMGVDIRDRPADLLGEIQWRQACITVDSDDITTLDGRIDGVVIAHEFLDDIPCAIVELDEQCIPRTVLVDSVTGEEEMGIPLTDTAMLDWLNHWWPPTRPGARREIGTQRDAIWRKITGILRSGTAIAIDYAHEREDRAAGLWDGGTLKGFSRGRPRIPIPDGSMNLTAHVALDALAQPRGQLKSQAEVLDGRTLASWPGGLGAYSWLFHPVEVHAT